MGTNYHNGLSTREQYDGSSTYLSAASASTKFTRKTAVIRCDAQTAETATGFTLPESAIVHDVFLNVIVLDVGETVDVGTQGTSNDPDGFLLGVSVNAAGLVYGSLADGAVSRGALLYEITETTTAAARMPDITAGGDPVSYTCSAGSDTAIFDIVIIYDEVTS
jgi:hypothetical protein